MKSIFVFVLTTFSFMPVHAVQSEMPNYSCRYTYSEPDGDEYETVVDIFLNQGNDYLIYHDSQLSKPVKARIDKIDFKTPDLVLKGTMTSPSWQPGADFVIRIGEKHQTLAFVLASGQSSKHSMKCISRIGH